MAYSADDLEYRMATSPRVMALRAKIGPSDRNTLLASTMPSVQAWAAGLQGDMGGVHRPWIPVAKHT